MENHLLDHFESDNTNRIEPLNYRITVGIAYAYQYSSQAIFSFGLAYFILFNTQYRREYLLSFIANYIVFHITTLGTLIFLDNLFTINILFCIILLFASFYKYKESLFPLNLSTLQKRYYVLMLLGLLPAILARTIDYGIFYFLK